MAGAYPERMASSQYNSAVGALANLSSVRPSHSRHADQLLLPEILTTAWLLHKEYICTQTLQVSALGFSMDETLLIHMIRNG